MAIVQGPAYGLCPCRPSAPRKCLTAQVHLSSTALFFSHACGAHMGRVWGEAGVKPAKTKQLVDNLEMNPLQ